jgi:hypothetical protein
MYHSNVTIVKVSPDVVVPQVGFFPQLGKFTILAIVGNTTHTSGM